MPMMYGYSANTNNEESKDNIGGFNNDMMMKRHKPLTKLPDNIV